MPQWFDVGGYRSAWLRARAPEACNGFSSFKFIKSPDRLSCVLKLINAKSTSSGLVEALAGLLMEDDGTHRSICSILPIAYV